MMLLKMVFASLVNFFNKNSIGKILNRISSDMEKMDKYIPYNLGSNLAFIRSILANLLLIIIFTDWRLGFLFILVLILCLRER